MNKKILLLVAILLVVPLSGWAQAAGVGVLPFKINSQEDLGYLSTGLQEKIINRLLERGVDSPTQDQVRKALKGKSVDKMSEDQARRIGQALNVQHVLFGSLTKVGDSISLDARLVDVSGAKRTMVLTAQGKGLENIDAVADKLVGQADFTTGGRNSVARVVVKGNERIETDAVLRELETRPGAPFSEDLVSADLKRIYNMNFFEDVKVDVEDSAAGKVVTFIVQEKPAIQSIEFVGNDIVEREDLVDVLGYNLYSIMDPKKLVDSVVNLRNLYREKGYYRAQINYELEDLGPKKVAVKYIIQEEGRIYVETIEFTGNEAFSDKKLRKYMETKEKGLFSYFTDSGILQKDKLNSDVTRLTAFYLDNGYRKVRIGDPKVTQEEDYLKIVIPVEEGPQYKVGKVEIQHDGTVPEEAIREELQLKSGEVYRLSLLRKDVQTIADMYADKGYANADVAPQSRDDDKTHVVDIRYVVDKKHLMYFERIAITGNDKTRDKVIRRELKIKEGDLFSAENMRKSTKNLHRLGFFEDVKITHSQGSAPDRMNVKIDVEERPTGSFAIGAGYSSYNKVFGSVSLSQDNLFGRGQKAEIYTTFGSSSTEYVLSFTEPWLFDIPLSFGVDLWRRDFEYDEYRQESIGGAVRLGYLLTDYVGVSGRYKYEDITISDIDEENVSQLIIDMEGNSSTSSIEAMIRRDTRDRLFNATEGSDNWFSVEYAGGPLGGTNAFTKYEANSAWYIPTGIDDYTFGVRVKGGYLVHNPDGDLPTYEKFFMGGLDSVRGFEYGDISPKDPETGDSIGGQKYALINFEFIFPIAKEAGLMGVVFHDQGNVWTKEADPDFGELRKSFGAGIRYYSPFGPMRLEYGRVIDPRNDEPDGNIEFSVGSFF